MRKGLLASLAAAALLAAPGLAVAQEPDHGETFGSLGWVTIPGAPLTSFDISWVDQAGTPGTGPNGLNVYFLADRSNASIDLFHIQVNPQPLKLTVAAPNQFAGNVPTCPIPNACNGPNGLITLLNPGSNAKEMWVGDGPTMTPGIGSPVCPTTCSTVKVFDSNGTLTHVISTGGQFRADELCFAPANAMAGRPNGLVLIANDSDAPPFISLIPTDGPNAYTVVQQIQFRVATNGIEQCQWDGTIPGVPQNGRFLLNVPEVNGPADDSVAGSVFTITGTLPATITPNPANLGLTGNVNITRCAGPQGMAIGPRPGDSVLLGCNAPTVVDPGPPIVFGFNNSVVIDKGTGAGIGGIIATLQGQGGADEVWFDPLAIHYFITGGSLVPAQTFGITDAATNQQDQNIFIGFTNGTTRRSHSTASWSGSGLGSTVTAAFVPVSATGGTPAPGFQSTVCGSSAAQGCIAVFGTVPIPTNDTADLD
jgi:hypothetical protein